MKIAIIGAGLVGERHARLAIKKGCLGCIVDPVPRPELAAELGTVQLDEVPDDIEGAIIATPNQTHAQVSIPLLERGIPCLVEKPIAATTADAKLIVEAERRTGTPVLVGYHRRHHPAVARAKEVVSAGTLGQLTVIDAKFWLIKPAHYFTQTWRTREGAGPIYINLTHDLDVLRHLVGDIEEIKAFGSNAIRGFEVEDSAAIVMRFKNGALGTVTVSDTTVAPLSWEFTSGENAAYPNVPGPAYSIGGTKGTISIPDLTLWQHPAEQSWWAPIEGTSLSVSTADALDLQLDHFLNVCAGREKPKVQAIEGFKSLEAVERVMEAMAK
ncbi:MAG: Gfo/Idh/MocA family oxidoreductase [Rhodobacteraceae bacterium]|nr:Gfo/Idh/MocA family oxidoreductase [Paracoccaceae bacterium]